MPKSSHPAESTTFDETSLPTHDQLVSLIQFELDRAEKMAARPGWTTWALWGALATVAWLAGREVKGTPIAWDAVESWFLFGSIFTDLILIISGSLNHESNKQNRGHRFFISNRSLGSARSVLVLLLLRYGILTVMGVHQFSLLPPWYAYPLVSHTILASVLFAILLVLSFANYPLPSTQASTWPKNIILALLILLVVIGTAGLLATLIKYPSSYTLEDISVAGLLWAATILVILLSMTRPRSPLIESLIDLRQDLGLNNIDVSVAKRQMEIVIHGLQVADILQQDVRTVLTPLRLALNAHEQISRDIEALFAQLPTDPSITLTNEQGNLISAVSRSVQSLLQNVMNGVGKSKAAATLFEKKAAFIIGTNPHTKPEIEVIRGKINSALDGLSERVNTSSAAINKLGERLRTIEPDKQKSSSSSTPIS